MGREKYLILFSALAFLLIISNGFYALPFIEIANPIVNSSYSVGDSIIIAGQITLDNSVAGATVNFFAISNKSGQTIPIATKYYNFVNNTPTTFSQINKETLSWLIPAEAQPRNDWQIFVAVEKEPDAIVNTTSDVFIISKALSISISANNYLFNLGEEVAASGTILDASKNPIKGSAKVYLSHAQLGTIFSDTLQIEKGFVKFNYKFKKSDPAGDYIVSFKITDSKGNQGTKTISGITVSKSLNLNCTIPKEQFSAGEEFDVIGNLRDVHNAPVDKVPLVALVTFPTKALTLSFSGKTDGNGNYAVHTEIPKLADPGNYALSIVADDGQGNIGTCEKSFFIPTAKNVFVELNLNSSRFYDKTQARAELSIKNNGNVDLAGKVSIIIDDFEVKSTDFIAPKGLESAVKVDWYASGSIGNHTISALLLSADGKVLTQTPRQIFMIYAHPEAPKKASPLQYFIAVGIVVIVLLLYFQRKEIRDYLWHLELKMKYGIGGRRILYHAKKLKEGEE